MRRRLFNLISVLKGSYPDNSVIVQKRQTSVTTYPFEEVKE